MESIVFSQAWLPRYFINNIQPKLPGNLGYINTCNLKCNYINPVTDNLVVKAHILVQCMTANPIKGINVVNVL